MMDIIRRNIPDKVRLAKLRLFGHLPGETGLHNRMRLRWLTRTDPESDFARALQETSGMIAVDLGANYGRYTERLAEVAAKVYAFEPDPDTLEVLRRNVGHLPNVEIVPEAAGAREDVLTLYRLAGDGVDAQVASEASTIMGRRDRMEVSDSGVKVRVADFPAFLDALDQDVGILKIDIEGAEVDLLDRMLETGAILRCRWVFVETHERLYPEQRGPVDALIRASRPQALRRRFPDAQHIPRVSLDWH